MYLATHKTLCCIESAFSSQHWLASANLFSKIAVACWKFKLSPHVLEHHGSYSLRFSFQFSHKSRVQGISLLSFTSGSGAFSLLHPRSIGRAAFVWVYKCASQDNRVVALFIVLA